MKFEDIKNNYNINLYLGILPENEERRNINKKNNFIGISNKLENLYHIKHDICKENIDLQDNTVTIFQAEDTLQYIEFENIEKIINEIYRLLKPGGLFRLSLPDYNFDIYNRRTLKNEEGKIIFDSGGGGGKPNFAQAGAKDIDKLSDALAYAKNHLQKTLDSHSDK